MNKSILQFFNVCDIKGLLIKSITVLFFLPTQAFSFSKLDSLKRELSVSISEAHQVEVRMEISRELHRLGEHEANEIEYALNAVEKALPLNDDLLYARALNNLGLLYRFHQQYAQAIPLHKKAYDLIEKKQVPAVHKMTFANNLAVASRQHSDYLTAVFYFMKALEFAEKEKDLRNIEIACNGLGNTLMSLPNRKEEALAYLQRALEVAKEANNERGMSMHYLKISDYYSMHRDYQTSRRYLNDLLILNRELRNQIGIAFTLQSIGKTYLDEGKQLTLAENYLLESLALFDKLHDRKRQAAVLYDIGDVYYAQNKKTRSLALFKQSLGIAYELNSKSLIIENTEMIFKIYEEVDDFHNALAFYKIAQLYKDSLNLEKQETEIEAINKRYNLAEKESEIEFLKKDKSLQMAQLDAHQAALKNRGVLISLMAFSLLTFVLLVILQTRNQKIKKRAERMLQKEEQEKLLAIYEKNLIEAEMLASRMQVNPHFLFNSLNSIKYLIQLEENKKAIDYLIVFSRFIRIVLETSQKPTSTICEELELANYYITLEKNRFDDHFSFEIDNELAEEDLADVILPTLLLQPFIENAVWHGLLPSKKVKKCILIKVSKYEEGIRIQVSDNGVGRKNNKNKHHGTNHKSMGTEITQERIRLFNKNYTSSIVCNIIDEFDTLGKPSGTRVELLIGKTLTVSKNKPVEYSTS